LPPPRRASDASPQRRRKTDRLALASAARGKADQRSADFEEF